MNNVKQNHLFSQKINSLCGAPGHHTYFISDIHALNIFAKFYRYIKSNGIALFLDREYPVSGDKHIIINQIDNGYYVVDGNKHLVSILLLYPNITIGELMQLHPNLFRFWKKGIESDSQPEPYDIYIPHQIDTHNIPDIKEGIDYFKPVPEPIKILPADVPSDSTVFTEKDRGYPLSKTAFAVKQKLWLSSLI